MSYSSGVASTAANLGVALDAFLIANGWTASTQSVVIASSSISYNPSTTSYSTGITTGTALNDVPLGAKITYPGSTANIYLVRKSSATTFESITDIVFTSQSNISLTFTWIVYSKGSIHITFSVARDAIRAISYILYDLLISPTISYVLTTSAEYAHSIRLPDSYNILPVSYELFTSINPDIVTLVLKYGTNRTEWCIFGKLTKIHDSAYVGGEFLVAGNCASLSYFIYWAGVDKRTASLIDPLLRVEATYGVNGTIFGSNLAAGSTGSGLAHCEIDGSIVYSTKYTQPNYVSITQNTFRKLLRGLNVWNSQSILVPIELQFKALSSFFMYLGFLEHIRYVRIDNYNSGDIITLGADKWKVYPLIEKNLITRDGETGVSVGTGHSGSIGFAVRYDGV